MSGYNDFTWWVASQAAYVFLLNGERKEIVDTYFASTPVHNSDEFIVKLEGDADREQIDWSELRKRFQEYKTAQTSA